jgi:lysine biosynthesis protein LysW
MNETFCPECENHLKVSAHPHKGQQLICPRCRTRLVVINLSPLELDWATAAVPPTPRKKKPNSKTLCPECNHTIKASQLSKKGQQIVCQVCQSTLEVISLNPLKLDPVSQKDLNQRSSRKMEQQNVS